MINSVCIFYIQMQITNRSLSRIKMKGKKLSIFALIIVLSLSVKFQYSYKSSVWHKAVGNNTTIIDKYFSEGNGSICHFETQQNKLKFQMITNKRETNLANATADNRNYEQTDTKMQFFAFLPPFQFDGSLLLTFNLSNIPLKIAIFQKPQTAQNYNQVPLQIIVQYVHIFFQPKSISFSFQNNTYILQLISQKTISFDQFTTVFMQLQLLVQYIFIICQFIPLILQSSPIATYKHAYELLIFNTIILQQKIYLFNYTIQLYGTKLNKPSVIMMIFLVAFYSIPYFKRFKQRLLKKIVISIIVLAYSALVVFGFISELWNILIIFIWLAFKKWETKNNKVKFLNEYYKYYIYIDIGNTAITYFLLRLNDLVINVWCFLFVELLFLLAMKENQLMKDYKFKLLNQVIRNFTKKQQHRQNEQEIRQLSQ